MTESSDKDRIRELEAKLALMTERAEKAEKELADNKARILLADQGNMQLMSIVVSCVEEIKQRYGVYLYEDQQTLIRIIERGLRSLRNVPNLSELIDSYAKMIRKTMTEASFNSTSAKLKTETQKLYRNIEKVRKEIRPKEKQLAKADKKLVAVAKGDESAQSIAKEILLRYEDSLRYPDKAINLNTHGRQAVEQLKNAQSLHEQVAQNILCPICHQPMRSNQEMRVCVRNLQAILAELVDNEQLIYPIYTCKCGHVHLGTDGLAVPVTPTRTLSQGLVLEAAHLMSLGTPLERVMTMIDAQKLQIGSSTLAENILAWMQEAGGKQMLDAIEAVAKSADSIVMDGTPLRILQQEGVSQKLVMLKGNGEEILIDLKDMDQRQALLDAGGKMLAKQPYLEIITSAPGSDMPFVVYKRMDSRSAESISDVMKGYKASAITTDAYVGYDTFIKKRDIPTSHQCCLVHWLREILCALPVEQYEEMANTAAGRKVLEEKYRELTADMRLNLCAKALRIIFSEENQLRRKGEESIGQWRERLYKVRQKDSRFLMDGIDQLLQPLIEKTLQKRGEKWVKTVDLPYVKPLVYYANHRTELRAFLDNPALPVDSNSAEQVIRAIAVLRSACQYKQSRKHTDVMCGLFTLFETADAAGIEKPLRWLKEFGHAFFTHCCDVEMTKRAYRGDDLTRAFAFTNEARASFDINPWLPWNYAKRATTGN